MGTRCVYHTDIPAEVKTNLRVYCMTPALLVHNDKQLGSTAHKARTANSLVGLSLLNNIDKSRYDLPGSSVAKMQESILNLQSKMRADAEIAEIHGQNDRNDS